MSTLKIAGYDTNVGIDSGKIRYNTTAGTDYIRVGDSITNAKRGSTGGLYIDQTTAPDHAWVIQGAVSNIALTADGAICVNDHAAEITGTARIMDMWQPIGIDVYGKIFVNRTDVIASRLYLGGCLSYAWKCSDGGLAITEGILTINNLLQEIGDDLLLEDNFKILLES